MRTTWTQDYMPNFSANTPRQEALPGSDWQSAESRLIIGFDGSVPEILDVRVSGSISGEIDCERYISSDGQRLILTPTEDFTLGEKVDIILKWSTSSTEWLFTVRPVIPPVVPFSCQEVSLFTGSNHETAGFRSSISGNLSNGVSVPSDFPELVLNVSGQPTEGNFFLGSLTAADATNSSYLIIADNDGEPLFYWHWNKGIFCVEVQPGGLLTFGTRLPGNVITWLVMNDTYTFQDSFTVSGYQTDIHDISMRENGHAHL